MYLYLPQFPLCCMWCLALWCDNDQNLLNWRRAEIQSLRPVLFALIERLWGNNKKSLRLDYHNLFVIFLRASPPGIHSTVISAPTFAKTQMGCRIVSGFQLRLYPTRAFYTTLRLIRSVVLIGSAIAKPPLMLLILLTNLLIITSEYQRKCKRFHWFREIVPPCNN